MDDFVDMAESLNLFSPQASTDLAPSYPSSKKISNAGGIGDFDCEVHYGRFVITESGNAELEAIMQDVLNGKKMLCWEKLSSTKEGKSFVTVKYICLKEKKDIKGKRRQRKVSFPDSGSL